MTTPPRTTTYPSPGGGTQPLLIWEPAGRHPVATVVFFHGGGWHKGSPEQFIPQCERLAAHGVLAVSAGYRLIGQSANRLADCLEDARAAARQVHQLAPETPLFLGGGSAGGHLALTIALTAGDALPCAGLVLFNPVVDLCDPQGIGPGRYETLGLYDRTAPGSSPQHLLGPGVPPAVVFHGTADALVPISSARRFRDTVQGVGGTCDLVEFDGAPHGFFNPGSGKAHWFEEPTAQAAAFVLARSAQSAATSVPGGRKAGGDNTWTGDGQ